MKWMENRKVSSKLFKIPVMFIRILEKSKKEKKEVYILCNFLVCFFYTTITLLIKRITTIKKTKIFCNKYKYYE